MCPRFDSWRYHFPPFIMNPCLRDFSNQGFFVFIMLGDVKKDIPISPYKHLLAVDDIQSLLQGIEPLTLEVENMSSYL